MKKNGFTLIEIIAVIVILGIVAAFVVPSIFSLIKESKNKSYNLLIDSLESNGRLYAERHQDEVNTSLDLNNYYIITLNDLVDEGLVEAPVLDPRDDYPISLNKTLIITRDTGDTFSVCFEDRDCYIPVTLVTELQENVVSGTTQGLHEDEVNNFYYFRGSNPNNWVEFNDYLWRIVKINSDNTIKLVFEGTKNEGSTTENGKIGTNNYNDPQNNDYNSSLSIKTYLQTWYDNNIYDDNKTKIKAINWCIGKVANGASVPKTTFLSSECTSTTTSQLSIGMLTVSEYLYASLSDQCLNTDSTGCMENNYLYKNNYDYWTMIGDSSSNNVWTFNNQIITTSSTTVSNVRPVINLLSTAVIDRGTGTIDSPYVIRDLSSEISDYLPSKGVNRPKLATGMTPIKWNGTTWIDTTQNDVDWYNYTTSEKQWANARTEDGSMWVWLPRYIYNISAGWHQQMTETTAGTIEVQFSMGTDDTREGTVILDTGTVASSSNNKWTNHPAFKFGDTELTGLWVAKFEASGTTSAIDIKPNVQSLRNTTVGNMFTATRGMETNIRYGWTASGSGIDTHLIKNIEWGAVAYLTQSSYGINGNIGINNNNSFTTGCGAASGSGSSSSCDAYDTSTGMLASTTGNIYGIYDMSGGAYEYVSAYIDNEYADDYGSSITSLTGANVKYKDIYNIGTTDTSSDNYAASINHKGDAVYETSGINDYINWYGDHAYMPGESNPWFLFGGTCNSEVGLLAGVFSFNISNGSGEDNIGFRPVLLVGTGF